jgi:hypothetical protein
MIKNRYYSHLKNNNDTVETSSNYSFSMVTPTSRTRNTYSFKDTHNYELLNDCDIEMLDNDLNVMPCAKINSNGNLTADTNISSLQLNNEINNDLCKIDENSFEDDNFDIQYNNIFNKKCKKESFEENLEDEYFIRKKHEINENENLCKQYQILDNVFNKIYEISTFKSDVTISKKC